MPDALSPFELSSRLVPVLGWLQPRHRGAVRAHLRRLAAGDRIARFGRALTDGDIGVYADELDFGRHWLAGAFSFDQRLIGFAHACPVRHGRDCTVFAAISVDAYERGHGVGRAMLGAIVDRLHEAAATTVVAIADCFAAAGGQAPGAHAYDLCAGVRIEAERLPCERAYRDTLARIAA